MRGGFVHNEVLINPLDTALRLGGATTEREYAVRVGDTICYTDLFATWGGRRLAIEAERSAHRVEGDLRKAEVLGADELWIVVPTARVAKSIRRKLTRVTTRLSGKRAFVLTQGQALQRVRDCLRLIAAR